MSSLGDNLSHFVQLSCKMSRKNELAVYRGRSKCGAEHIRGTYLSYEESINYNHELKLILELERHC
jgi:hypothetical protein